MTTMMYQVLTSTKKPSKTMIAVETIVVPHVIVPRHDCIAGGRWNEAHPEDRVRYALPQISEAYCYYYYVRLSLSFERT